MAATSNVQPLHPGQLRNNGMQVLALQTALSRSETNLGLIPKLVQQMAREEAWREYTLADQGEIFHWTPAQFRRFIESPRTAGGCETPIHTLERCCHGTNAWETFLDLVRGQPGSPPGGNNPNGVNQHSEPEEVNYDNVIVNQPADPPKPPPCGNSVSYTVRRLKRERPDLFERVKAKEMTANAAALEAGFREKQITIPADPRKAARRLVRHFSREEFSALVDEAIGLYAKPGKNE